jgi:periplasmic protein CpxP/Spy
MSRKNNDASQSHPINDSSSASKRTNRPLLAVMLATGMAAVTLVGFASGATGMDAHHGQGHHGNAYAQIDLEHLHAIVAHISERASPDQKAKIEALAAASREELMALNEQAVAAHRQKVELLLQDRIDANAFERARLDEMQAADRLAQRIDEALVDLAEILTPEQRAQFRAHAKEHHG